MDEWMMAERGEGRQRVVFHDNSLSSLLPCFLASFLSQKIIQRRERDRGREGVVVVGWMDKWTMVESEECCLQM